MQSSAFELDICANRSTQYAIHSFSQSGFEEQVGNKNLVFRGGKITNLFPFDVLRRPTGAGGNDPNAERGSRLMKT